MSQARWYPTTEQLKDPISIERAFRQVLRQHYDLQDKYNALKAKVDAPPSEGIKGGAPPGSGPSDSMLLGLPVAPIDPQALANGATLKYNKSKGRFEIS